MQGGQTKNGGNGYGDSVAQFSVRMPDELRARIKVASERDRLSMNAWLCIAAERALAGMLRSEDVLRLDAMEQALEVLGRRMDEIEGRHDSL